MKTVSVNLYSFNELSIESKAKVLKKYSEINLDYDWWNVEYDDMMQTGLKCNGFDLDRGSYCKLEFINGAMNCVRYIMKNHGKDCDTYHAANRFRLSVELLEEDMDDDFNEAKSTFLSELETCYLKSLRAEYEYRYTDEAIIEAITSNDYLFLENGVRFINS